MPGKNRLADEKSPYLLQHADNPVDWYPWGKEAFEIAAEEDKPVFLSIGYSSCHWCHVMERECFSDGELASLLNDACVSIKVDREERPDLDALFMEVCCLQNGSGGWPLNLFLTPQGEPFFAATYLPKRTAGQMPGLADMTPRVKWLWLMQKEDVLRSAKNIVEVLTARAAAFSPGGQIGSFHVRAAMKALKSSFDKDWGGFGDAPKFPCAPRLLFLLELARGPDAEAPEALSMIYLTLRKMWAGGIHDHLGGGYARYATDERWIMPHFEKMLCDQAMLLWVTADAYEVSRDAFYLQFAEDLAACVMRDFTSPESCFWTSLDADSEGNEGQYYFWTEEEIREALPQGDTGIFCAAYAVMPGGNFAHEMTSRQTGHNVLYEALSYTEVARRYGLRGPDVAKRLENGRRVLLEARNRRTPPELDDKVLMDWNGLMIGALARAGRIFEKKEWVLLAERAALFLQKILIDPKGAWRRRYRAKEAAIPALPGDYAALMWGVTELCKAASAEKQKKDWRRYAENLAAKLEAEFWDEANGGFFLSAADDPLVFLRRKAALDDAAPSANAMAMMAYAALAEASPEDGGGGGKYLEKAAAIASCFVRPAGEKPVEHISLITASLKLKEAQSAVKEALKDAAKDAKEEPEAEEEPKAAADIVNQNKRPKARIARNK